MLCIAVAPESRRLGKVDLFNAAPQCDLIEFRLDRLGETPDIPEMLEGISKPVLISCRRAADGGAWRGTEDERLTLLRSAIVAGPAYIELELDIADKIPRFGKTKRVVSYTKLDKPLTNIEPTYERAVAAKADVVKFVGPTPTLDAAWPLLATVSKKRTVPVVGMGLGRSGLMFSVLGLKFGSPWIYAALEKGLEAYEGQPTVTEMDEIYRWRDIGPQTRFVAVTGFGPTETTTVKLMNAAFDRHQLKIRCLPLEYGKSEKFAEMLDALHINVVLTNPYVAERILNMAPNMDEAARISQYADLIVKQQDGWHAFNTIWRSALRAVEAKLGATTAEDRPLDKRNVLLIGSGGAARGVAYGVQRRKGLMSVTASDNNEAQQMARMFNARYVPIANMYDTLCDVVIIAEAQTADGIDGVAGSRGGTAVNPSFLRPHMTVTDLSDLPNETQLISEARMRGCKIVDPIDIYAEHIASTFKSISGKEVSSAEMAASLRPAIEDE